MTNLTREQFINSEVAVWGEDYILDVLDKGYLPILTTAGWKWRKLDNDEYDATVGESLDRTGSIC